MKDCAQGPVSVRRQHSCSGHRTKGSKPACNCRKDNQLRNVLDGLPIESLAPIFADFLGDLQRGKHLTQYQLLGGKYLIPIDGFLCLNLLLYPILNRILTNPHGVNIHAVNDFALFCSGARYYDLIIEPGRIH
jgi:hypothetical protein